MGNDLISRSALYEQVAEYEEQARNRYFDTPPESDYRQVCMEALTEITSVKHMIYGAPAVDAVPIDDMFCEMMSWAVRYALGRRTYAASDTANYVLHLVPKLDDKTLTVIAQDIRERGDNLGDECDAVWWRKLLDAVVAEMIRRKDNGNNE